MSKSVIIPLIVAAGISVLIMKVFPVKKKARQIFRSIRNTSRRQKFDYLDIYID